jgi:hypothetical protein
MDASQLGTLIPIVAIVMGIGLAIVGTLTDHQRKAQALEQRHRERMAAIEKGIEIPPELDSSALSGDGPVGQRKPERFLLRGLVCLGIGIAILISSFTVLPQEVSFAGNILVALGVALLLYYFFGARKANKEPEAEPPPN